MTFNNLKQTLRLLFKEKRITIINITGLSISLACALFMLLWVEHELSYDRFHKDFKQLYRVEEDQYYSGEEPYHVNVTPYVSGPVWKDEVPEITEQCRIAYSGDNCLPTGKINILKMASWPWIPPFSRCSPLNLNIGNKENVLREPYSMVITEEISKKYFGDENPSGTFHPGQSGRPVHHFRCGGKTSPQFSAFGFSILFPWNYMKSQPYYTGFTGGPIPSRPL